MLQLESGIPGLCALLTGARVQEQDNAELQLHMSLCSHQPYDVPGRFKLDGEEWRKVSDKAKDKISRILTLDSGRRASAGSSGPAAAPSLSGRSNALGALMLTRLRHFGALPRMTRLALKCLVRTLRNNDTTRLLTLFQARDPGRTERLDMTAFREALADMGAVIDCAELEALLEYDDDEFAIDGCVDYNDFVAALLDTQFFAKQREAIVRSFEALDMDRDGAICAADIVNASRGRFSLQVARVMIAETLPRGSRDLMIDYATFERLMHRS